MLQQIGRKSTAATTTFVHTGLRGADGRVLWLDGNQKITAGNGDFSDPRPNALSLLDRVDCPQRTPTCERACYVQNLAAAQPDLYALYAHNSETIREIVESQVLRAAWALQLGVWIAQNAKGGFRWHVSGDIISDDHARFIALTCKVTSGTPVRHWIYTRSFAHLEPLLEVATVNGGNLAINLSADRDNYRQAGALAMEHGLRVCYLATELGDVPEDLVDGDVIFPDYPLRGPGGAHAPSETRAGSVFWQSLTSTQRRLVCPVDLYGKSEGVRCGPCRKCLE
jgi:hypothetical protein